MSHVYTWDNKCYRTKWMLICRIKQIDPYLSTCRKLKSKWIKNLIIKSDMQNLIEEKIRNNLEHIDIGDKFLYRTE